MTTRYLVEPLTEQDRSGFSCGVPALDAYFKERVGQDIKRNVAGCFVMIDPATRAVAGYYTLAATSVLANELPTETLERLPRYPALPAALIGRLAVDTRFQKRGLGGELIADAALRVLKGGLKAFALVVDAKDENAVSFYRFHGFHPFAQRPLSLWLPLQTFKKALLVASPKDRP